MNRIHRTALAVASAVACAALTAGCGALHDAPISNAKANKNSTAIKEANSYSGVSQQAAAQEEKATREKAEKDAAAKATESKAKVDSKKAKSDPVGTRNDIAPVANTSDIPAWVIAINWAQTKLGMPYVWGGESDAEGGFDCSGLMQAAYAQAGIRLPRVAQDQYDTTDVHPTENELRPGDLVFFGTRHNLHHVGLYVGKDPKTGKSMMLHAPNSRTVIKFSPVHYMSDYYGATRVSP